MLRLRIKAEAKANEEADKKERESAEKINAADSLIFQTEKQLKEYGDKLSAGNKSAIESALAELKTAHGSRNAEAIDTSLASLNKAWEAASQEMYSATQGAGGPEAGGGAAGGQGPTDAGGVTDVDYEEVDSNKNK